MGLDMYLSCNSRTLSERLVERGLIERDSWYRRSGTIGYWRKANQVHRWFVDNVQSGEDDCGKYEVTVDSLAALKAACDEVIERSVLEDSDDCYGGARLGPDGWERICRKGKVVTNPEVAEAILPSAEGFFFGSTDYDDRYMQDLEYTSRLIGAILDEVEREKERFAFDYHVKGEKDWAVLFQYHSSW